MDKQPKHLYEFGPFRLDAAERTLLRNGVPVPLTPKAFDTLLVLVENSGHLLDKDDLMRRVWPETFVEEGGLTRNISSLRKALVDGSGEQQYIETVPKRGYRFTAAVSEVTEEPNETVVERHTRLRVTTEEEIAETETESKLIVNPKSRTRPRPMVVALTIQVLVAVGVTAYLLASNTAKVAGPDAPLRSMAVLPFKNLTTGADENLGLGIADALITKLGVIKQLTVRPTSSVIRYAGQSQDPAMIGRELNVESVLDGSVQRVDGNVRISLQLINVRDGATIWTAKIDEESRDIFRLQDDVAAQVLDALSLRLANAEQAKFANEAPAISMPTAHISKVGFSGTSARPMA